MHCGSMTKKIMLMVTAVCLTLSLTAVAAMATVAPSASYSYTATRSSSQDWWQYNLRVTNNSTSDDPLYGDLYYFNFLINDGAVFAGGGLPSGWESQAWEGPIQNGPAGYPNFSPEAYIQGPGILPGDSLSFTFGLNYLAPQLTFTSLVWTPDVDENGDPLPAVLQTEGTLQPSTVPEPSTLLLVGAGLAGAIAWRRKHPAA